MTPMQRIGHTLAAVEHAISQADGEAGDAQRALRELAVEYRRLWYAGEAIADHSTVATERDGR